MSADIQQAKLKHGEETPHLGASTAEAQEMVAVEAADILSGFLLRSEIRHAVNMVPISAAEMEDLQSYLDLSYRLGLLLAQQNQAGGQAAKVPQPNRKSEPRSG